MLHDLQGFKPKVLALVLVTVSAFALVGTPAPARAATLTVTRTDDPVPDGCKQGDCSLREAIIAANATPVAETITLDTTMYHLGLAGANEDASVTGDLDILGSLTLQGANTSQDTFVDGHSLDRVFDIHSGDVTLQNLTIRHGQAGGDGTVGGDFNGGGIRNAAVLTLSAVVQDNTAPVGSRITMGVVLISVEEALSMRVH